VPFSLDFEVLIGYFNSKSWTKTVKENQLIQDISERKRIEKAFAVSFVQEAVKYDLFVELCSYLKKCRSEWTSHTKHEIYGPIVSICQSSGNGKTRCINEFSKKHLSFFICLRAHDETGYPPRSTLATRFIEAMESVDSAKRFLLVYIQSGLRCIDDICQNTGHHDNDELAAVEFMKYQHWKLEPSEEQQKFVEYFENNHQTLAQIQRDCTIRRDVTKRPLFFFIDEAKILLEDAKEKENALSLSKFGVFRQAVIDLFERTEILFVLSETISRISSSDFSPNPKTITASERSTSSQSKKLFKPFYSILFNDALVPREYFEGLNVEGSFNFKSLKERDPRLTIFMHGRPLWASIIKADENVKENAEHAIQLAKLKLICANSYESVTSSNKIYACLALLCTRTTLMLSYDIPYGSELVARYMSTLFNINYDRTRTAAFIYLSEPVLAEAAANIMQSTNDYEAILDTFNSFIQTLNLDQTGAIGEIVAQLILLKAFDQASLANKSKL
jgi:hypothetical protein